MTVHFVNDLDYDYYFRQFPMSEYVIDVVKYISSYIVRKIRKMKNTYIVCDSQLTDKKME